jgi:hypothetical protein
MENSGFVLFVEPSEELLKSGIGQNRFNCVEPVTKLIVTPGLVDEVLA